MAIKIGFFITKGGNAKTTSALEMAFFLKRFFQKKILFLDIDPQKTSTNFLTIQENENIGSIFDVLTGEKKITEIIRKGKHVDFIASSTKLNHSDTFLSEVGKDRILKENLDKIKDNYDVIIIDFPPAATKLTICGLTAIDKLLIPCQADSFSIDSLNSTNELHLAVKKYLNPSLELGGVLLTRYKKTLLSEEIIKAIEKIALSMGTFVYKSKIRESILIREAQLAKSSINKRAGHSPVSSDIFDFIDEFGERYVKEI